MWARIHLVAVAILLAGPARAAGVGMQWNDCLSAGARDLQATCDANDGRSVLVGWFDPPAGITALIGEEVVVDLCAMAPDLPSWWQLGAGECRASARLRRLVIDVRRPIVKNSPPSCPRVLIQPSCASQPSGRQSSTAHVNNSPGSSPSTALG